jgi:hypothetical protein
MLEEEDELVIDESVLAAIDSIEPDPEPQAPVGEVKKKKEPKARAKKAPGEGAKPAAKKIKTAPQGGGEDDKETLWKRQIVDYMFQQNRPYSSQNVFDNLHGAIPKAQTAVLLEKLCSEEEAGEEGYPPLVMKTFGAAKVNVH